MFIFTSYFCELKLNVHYYIHVLLSKTIANKKKHKQTYQFKLKIS